MRGKNLRHYNAKMHNQPLHFKSTVFKLVRLCMSLAVVRVVSMIGHCSLLLTVKDLFRGVTVVDFDYNIEDLIHVV